jgi:ATP-binding cassette, subfamily B, bacterial
MRKSVTSMLFIPFLLCPAYSAANLALAVLMAMTTPVFVYLQKWIIDTSTSSNVPVSIAVLVPTLAAYFCISWFEAAGGVVQRYLGFRISSLLERELYNEHIETVSRLEYSEYEVEKNQNLVFKIDATIMGVVSNCISFVPAVLGRVIELGSILYFLVLSGCGWLFPVVILISIPSFHFNKKRMEYARQVWDRNNTDMRYTDYLKNAILNRDASKERKIYGFANFLAGKWRSVFGKYNRHKISVYTKSSVSTGLAMCFSMSSILLIGIALLQPLQAGIVSMGLYASILLAVDSKMNMCISAVIKEVTNIVGVRDFVNDVGELASLRSIGSRMGEDGYADRIGFESIVFDDVHFRYPGTREYILKGVSFRISKGEHYALIGLNGVGKTTMTKLMTGQYPPTKGRILINDKEIGRYSMREIHSFFVYMQQRNANYKMSAAENIGLYSLGRGNDPARIDAVIERCGLSGLKPKLGANYGTILDPEFSGGIALSGGEWQKLAFARACSADRDFAIFDEPTSALDPMAETAFYRSYKEAMAGKSCLFITHRLGSTFLFDRCLVLSEGVIAEAGTHDELMDMPSGIYKELFNMQRSWYETKECQLENT